MKQESVNQFNGGLIKDLNPLVTPNNVLTDVVNGSFITFNGNELMLQNDMGNIAIRKNAGTEANPIWEDVHLGEGFFPVGIKEYGGILYIVSSRAEATITANGVTIPVPEIYDPELSYSAGSYVSVAKKISIPDGIGGFTITEQPWYYKAMVDIDPQNPPVAGDNTSAIWRLFADYNTPTELTIVETQVGSYPSPQQTNAEERSAEIRLSTWDLLNGVELQKQFGNLEVSGGTNLEFKIQVLDDTDYEDSISILDTDTTGNAGDLVDINNRGKIKYYLLKKYFVPEVLPGTYDHQAQLDLWESQLDSEATLVAISEFDGTSYPILTSFYDYLTGYVSETGPELTKRLFKLSILQLLSNGAIDITPTFKREFVNDGIHYWFSQSGGTYPFKNFVQNRFKGKLIAKLEFEEIDYFLATTPVVKVIVTEGLTEWEVSIGISTKTSSFISVDKVQIYFNNELYSVGGKSEFDVDQYGLCTITRRFTATLAGQTIEYAIKPIFNYEDLPITYINKYEVNGSFVIATTGIQIEFEILSYIKEPNESNPLLSKRKASVIVLKNKGGGYLDEWYNLTTIPYLFVLDGTLEETLPSIVDGDFRIISYFNYIDYLAVLPPNSVENLDLASIFQATKYFYITDPSAGNYPTQLYSITKLVMSGDIVDYDASVKQDIYLEDDDARLYEFTSDNSYSLKVSDGLYYINAGDYYNPQNFWFTFSGGSTSFILYPNEVYYKIFYNGGNISAVCLCLKTRVDIGRALILPVRYRPVNAESDLILSQQFTNLPYTGGTDVEISLKEAGALAYSILWTSDGLESEMPSNAPIITLELESGNGPQPGFQADFTVLQQWGQYRTYEFMLKTYGVQNFGDYSIETETLFENCFAYISTQSGDNNGLVFYHEYQLQPL